MHLVFIVRITKLTADVIPGVRFPPYGIKYSYLNGNYRPVFLIIFSSNANVPHFIAGIYAHRAISWK